MLDLAPETYYSIALDRIDDWEQNYFETYKMFERELTQNGMSIAELKTDLKQYSQKTLILFKEIYPKVTAEERNCRRNSTTRAGGRWC